MRKPTKLPPIEILECNFTYDPVTGVLYSKHGNPLGNNDRSTGQMKVRLGKGKTVSMQRVCWALFHRKDPIHYRIIHIDKNPRNNRIDNLRAVKL